MAVPDALYEVRVLLRGGQDSKDSQQRHECQHERLRTRGGPAAVRWVPHGREGDAAGSGGEGPGSRGARGQLPEGISLAIGCVMSI